MLLTTKMSGSDPDNTYDIFYIWSGPESDIQAFFTTMNSFHSKMKFTLEVGGSHINYLDPTITLIPHDLMLVTSWSTATSMLRLRKWCHAAHLANSRKLRSFLFSLVLVIILLPLILHHISCGALIVSFRRWSLY